MLKMQSYFITPDGQRVLSEIQNCKSCKIEIFRSKHQTICILRKGE